MREEKVKLFISVPGHKWQRLFASPQALFYNSDAPLLPSPPTFSGQGKRKDICTSGGTFPFSIQAFYNGHTFVKSSFI
jgi:hypothetical protein